MKTYDLKLTHEQMITLQAIISQDIEDTIVSDPEIDDFFCIKQTKYWMHRAEVFFALQELSDEIIKDE
jgi:uncharacterized protein YjiS (DUF1127 family)